MDIKFFIFTHENYTCLLHTIMESSPGTNLVFLNISCNLFLQSNHSMWSRSNTMSSKPQAIDIYNDNKYNNMPTTKKHDNERNVVEIMSWIGS